MVWSHAGSFVFVCSGFEILVSVDIYCSYSVKLLTVLSNRALFLERRLLLIFFSMDGSVCRAVQTEISIGWMGMKFCTDHVPQRMKPKDCWSPDFPINATLRLTFLVFSDMSCITIRWIAMKCCRHSWCPEDGSWWLWPPPPSPVIIIL